MEMHSQSKWSKHSLNSLKINIKELALVVGMRHLAEPQKLEVSAYTYIYIYIDLGLISYVYSSYVYSSVKGEITTWLNKETN